MADMKIISNEKQVECISKVSSKKENKVFSPWHPYAKSYCRTRIESTTFDYTWKIDRFMHLLEVVGTLCSSSFPEKNQFSIQISTSHETVSESSKIQFRICTNETFYGSCIIKFEITSSSFHDVPLPKSISGFISDMTLLIEIPKCEFKIEDNMCIIIYFKIEVFLAMISNTLHTNLPASLTVSSAVKSLTESIIDECRPTKEKSIKLIIGAEQYVIFKKLLWSTNSSYFKKICLTNEKEKDMKNELTTCSEVEGFTILLSILTDSQSIESLNYYNLKSLLIVADKYDVPTLKLACEHCLQRHISILNAVELIQLSFSFNAKFLEKHTAIFIKFYMKEIMNTETFRDLTQEDSDKIKEVIDKIEIPTISTLVIEM